MDFNTLTTTLTNFVTAFQGGYTRLAPAINGLLGVLAGIEIVLLGFWWALGGGERLGEVIKKLLFLGFWLWFTKSFQTNAKAFVDSLIQAGLIAGGRPGSYQLLLDPSRIAAYGLQATEALSKALDNVGFDLADALIFGLSYLALMAAFMVMAIQAFLAVVEYYLLVAVVGILIPFGVLPQTKFLAEKAIGAIVSAGIKLMVLAFIMAVAEPVLSNVRFSGPEIKLNELWSVLLTCGAISFLAWNAPSLAAGLLAGSPSLGAAGVAQNLAAGTMLAAGVAGGMVAATRAAAGGASALAGHAAHAAGVVAGGAAAGVAAAENGSASPLAGGARGAHGAAGRAAVRGAAAGLARVTSPITDRFREGARSAMTEPPAWAQSAARSIRKQNARGLDA
jgi:type IV secretion system protein TrbL